MARSSDKVNRKAQRTYYERMIENGYKKVCAYVKKEHIAEFKRLVKALDSET